MEGEIYIIEVVVVMRCSFYQFDGICSINLAICYIL